MRKIIQISAIPCGSNIDGRVSNSNDVQINDETLYALCDDGRVFYIIVNGVETELHWTAIPPIPQDESTDRL